ncbi:MAG: Integrin alpha beta-propellor repeat protein [Verrucomicrobiales bacterium]|nr:Integrin alpha beta-propellor repeat protein [Verrucomicrobiales bacterium]
MSLFFCLPKIFPGLMRPGSVAVPALLLFLCFTPCLKGEQSGDFTFIRIGSTATITGYTGSAARLVIPDRLDELPVTALGTESFLEKNNLSEIIIPHGVTSIGIYAFSKCSSLTSVTIPDSVKSIGAFAFLGCIGLTGITIPDSVTSIGYSAFLGCDSLTSVRIPDGVRSIEPLIFQDCTDLTGVTLPDGITTIGDYAFAGCSRLSSIRIPEGATSIGEHAFSGCSSLTGKMIPGSVSSIGAYAFSQCSGLTSVTIPEVVTSIGAYAFYQCSSLTSVTIPEVVTSIRAYAFSECSGLTVVTVPDGVTSIGVGTFLGCNSLTSITIPDSVTSIGYSAFLGCSRLTGVTIPDGITSIEPWIFQDCSSLISITIPDSVIAIGSGAFSSCSQLTSIRIPDGVTSIGEHAFSGCSGLTGKIIPESVTTIGDYAFAGCSRLTDIRIPDGVIAIGDSVFFGCSLPDSITIPASVKSMSGNVFAGCSGLVRVIFEGNAPATSGAGFGGPADLILLISDGRTGFTFPLWHNRRCLILDSLNGPFVVLRGDAPVQENDILNMGTGLAGSTITQVFSILNTGDVPQSMAVSLSAGSSMAFSLKRDSIPDTIAPWKTASFTVLFSPGEAGPMNAGINVVSSGPLPEPYRLNLTGTGVAPAAFSQQAYIKASNSGREDFFGDCTAVSGDTLVVGAPNEDSSGTGEDDTLQDSGAVYVFVKSETGWIQQARLKASNAGSGDHFGITVSIDGDTIIVGASGEGSAATGFNGDQSNDQAPKSGAAYVFTRAAGVWTQQAYLKASNTGTGDFFGNSVSISGNTAAVGARLEDSHATGVNGDQTSNNYYDSGAVYVFERTGRVWRQSAWLKASNTAYQDQFGHCVGISGTTLVVTAPGEDSNATGVNGIQTNNSGIGSGAAYVFVKTGFTWSQQAYLKASNTDRDDTFGHSAAISGNTIIIGAPYERSRATGVNGNQTDNSYYDSGAAYIFVRTGSDWSQEAYLKATNGTLSTGISGGSFGWNVSISGDTAVAGAHRPPAGEMAYVFQRSGATWIQHTLLKASNSEIGDHFGRATAVSGDTIAIGASGESSASTGIGGDQSDNNALDAGAAYIFQTATGPDTVSIQQWRLAHFGTVENARDAADTSDPDGDGSPNLEEFTAGTLPKDGGDTFKVFSARRQGEAFTLTMPGRVGRAYQLVRSSNPATASGFWISVASVGPVIADGVLELTDPAPPAGRAFYRVIVSLP